MVRSMLSWSPSERPEAAEIIGTPLFQELELELPCRLAVRQRSRTYSASSMGRPSRQTSSTWKSHDAICNPHDAICNPHPTIPLFPFHPPAGLMSKRNTSAPCHNTASDRITLNAKCDKRAGIYLCGFGAARQSLAQLFSLANTHAVTYSHTIMLPTFPILITLTSERIF